MFELDEEILAHVPVDAGQELVMFELDEDILAHVPVDVGQIVVEALLLDKHSIQAPSKELPSEKETLQNFSYPTNNH
jgi:hypothetical protein